MDYNFAKRMNNLQASAIREILKFTSDPSVISFAAGNPAPEAFPTEKIEKITTEILKNTPIAALQYSITEGYTPLRDFLKRYLKETLNVGTDNDDLIIVSGAQQGTEHTTKVLCDPGDTVICENPSFIGSLNAFKSYDVNLVGVEVESDGISIEGLREALKQNKNTKFIYLIPNFQNPTGITMSLTKRKAVYALARDFDVLILEDNPYGQIRFKGKDIPNIKSFDTDGRVIYVGSFSKILSPGLRVGYVVAPKEITQKIVVCKQISDVHTNILAQMICYEFMANSDLNAHFEKLAKIYEHKCGLMINEIEKHFSKNVAFTRPEGGLFIWCTIPEQYDVADFCKTAVMNKIATVPGTAFLPSEVDQTSSFRLNFSTPTDEQIVDGIKLLGELTKEKFE